MKTISIILSLLGVILLDSFKCTKGVDYIYIENKSSTPVYYQVSFAYPDSTLATVIAPPDGLYIPVNSKVADIGSTSYFAYNDTLQYFIFDADSIKKYTWEEIQSKKLYLKRYVYSKQDLIMRNWIITYQ